MRPKRKEGWETSDGAFFTSHPEACIHEESLQAKMKIERWAHTHCWSNMSISEIIDVLAEYGEELNQI